jgi:16S rRNA U516 pseudouridylate synthase RsuA-like enzyme
MFARFDLKVIALHREAIGGIELPDDLPMGAWRELD